jgi:hypothetical protein
MRSALVQFIGRIVFTYVSQIYYDSVINERAANRRFTLQKHDHSGLALSAEFCNLMLVAEQQQKIIHN